MNILYIGKVTYGNTCYSKYRGFIRHGWNPSVINIEDYKITNLPINKISAKLSRYNTKRILSEIKDQSLKKYDYIFFDQPFYIDSLTIDFIKNNSNSKIIFHFTDDIEYLRHGLLLEKKIFEKCDYIFTCNHHSINYLKTNGIDHVYFNELGYDDEYLTKSEVDKFKNDSVTFGFIGHFEEEYKNSIDNISKTITQINNESVLNARLHVYGTGWRRNNLFKSPKYLQSQPLFNKGHGSLSHENYWKLISEFEIGVGLFSSMNRNRTAGRTFEIPASNTILFTKGSDVISNLFEDRETAIFWEDNNLNDVIQYTLSDKSELNRICKNGHEFIKDNKFTWFDRVGEIIKTLN